MSRRPEAHIVHEPIGAKGVEQGFGPALRRLTIQKVLPDLETRELAIAISLEGIGKR